MCDRDHSAEDRERYEALGLITRKQFGVMLAAGVAMLLPKVANAATVIESDVTVKTPARHRGLLLRPSSYRHRAWHIGMAGYLRAAAGNAPDG